jgi:acyl-coenzyme A synthetase/AMP-(fatty) acid ligase
LNREDLNQTQFVVKNNERWYNSGDRAFLSDSGELLYMGRQDNQMKIQGFRIEAAEVEFHLKKCLPEGNRVVAVAVNNGRGITELVAISENFQWPISEVKQALLKYLPSYMVPSHYLDFPEFPLNNNGKIDRKQLASWAEKKI